MAATMAVIPKISMEKAKRKSQNKVSLKVITTCNKE